MLRDGPWDDPVFLVGADEFSTSPVGRSRRPCWRWPGSASRRARDSSCRRHRRTGSCSSRSSRWPCHRATSGRGSPAGSRSTGSYRRRSQPRSPARVCTAARLAGSRTGRLTDTTRASTSHRRGRPGEAGQGRRHPGHDAGVHVHGLFRHLHGQQPAADAGDLRRGAQGPEDRVADTARDSPTSARRSGSSPTTSTWCCTCSRRMRGRTTRSRICGATCLPFRSRLSRPSTGGSTGPRMTSSALHLLGSGP